MQQDSRQRLVYALLSVGFHTIVLALFHHLVLHTQQPSPHTRLTYAITWSTQIITKKKKPIVSTTTPKKSPSSGAATVKPQTPTPSPKKPREITVSQPPLSSSKVIDQRSLYPHQQNTSTVSLDLPGWEWDAAPQVVDPTSDTGKIVFRITVDEFGDIIAVETLEKTVGPMAEQPYKEALLSSTLREVTGQDATGTIATGKVEFVLRPE